MGLFADFAAHWPFLLTMFPLCGAMLAAIQARRGFAAARQTAVVNATLTLIAALAMTWQFATLPADSSASRMNSRLLAAEIPIAIEPADESPPVKVHFQLAFGVDGISLIPLLMLAIIGWVVIVTANPFHQAGPAIRVAGAGALREAPVIGVTASGTSPPAAPPPPTSYAGLLLGQSLGMALFAAQDFTLFLIAGECWAWWLFAMVGRSGGTERRAAARHLLLVSWWSHALVGLAVIGMAVSHFWMQTAIRGGSLDVSFQYADIITRQARWVFGNETALRVWLEFQPWILPLWIGSLIVRWPLPPFHTWWSALLTQARPPVAALAGSVMILEIGMVWLRFIAPLCPTAGTHWAAWLAAWAGCGVLWCGLSAITQTDKRRLAGLLVAGSLQLTLIAALSGNAAGSLATVQMLGSTALALTTMILSLGRCEPAALPRTIESSNRSISFSVERGCWILAGGVLGLCPVVSLLTGSGTVRLIAFQNLGISHSALVVGSLLLSWAVVKHAISWELPVEKDARRLSLRDSLIALPVLLVLMAGLLPAVWQPVLRPSMDVIHDPFVVTAPSTTITTTTISPATSEAFPQIQPTPRDTRWQSASAVWAIVGVVLLLWPAAWRHSRWSGIVAVIGLLIGGAVELSSNGGLTESARIDGWSNAVWWLAGLIGVVILTVRPDGAQHPTSEAAGALLLRLAAAAFAAQTNDLALAGLAWELAELTRRLCLTSPPEESQARENHEKLRLILSSACFWSGVVLLYWLTQSTQLSTISIRLAETIPRNIDGDGSGAAARFGLIGLILILSALGSRCGLLPWSFGRSSTGDDSSSSPFALHAWLDRLIGLTLLNVLIHAVAVAYGGPLGIMLSIAAAATAGWSIVAVFGERKVAAVIQLMLTWQFAALVLLVAGCCAADASSLVTDAPSWSRIDLWPLITAWFASVTMAACGVTAALCWIGRPTHGATFLEHHQGLLAKRPGEAALLMVLLAGLLTRCPLLGFWPQGLGLIGLVMLPQRLPNDDLRSQPVLIGVAVIVLLTGGVHLAKLAEWFRFIAFDSPLAAVPSSPRWWPRAVTSLAALATTFGWLSLWWR